MTQQRDIVSYTELYLTALFRRLNELNVQYCVLHSYEQLPYNSRSDVDFAIDKHGIQTIDDILIELAENVGTKLIQKVYHGIPSSYSYVVAYTVGISSPRFIQLDFHYDRHGIGRDYVPTSLLLLNRRWYRGFYVSDASIEAVHLLMKRIIKGNLQNRHKLRIEQLYRENQRDITRLLREYLGKRATREAEENICSGNWEKFCRRIARYQRCMWFRKFHNSNIWYITQSFAWHLARAVKRFTYPTGLMVVLLGPDGSGKTCVGDAICKQMLNGFRQVKHIHWRPGLLPPLSALLRKRKALEEDYTQPHSAKPHGSFISLLRFFYYAIDFVLGYWLKIRILKVRNRLVCIDRYYYDYLIDTRRYRLKLPQWLIHAVMKVIPKPDMVIYLYGTPENLYERKQEITIEELTRQVREFQEIVPELPNAYRIETDKSLDEVVCEVTSIILDFMARRVNGRIR